MPNRRHRALSQTGATGRTPSRAACRLHVLASYPAAVLLHHYNTSPFAKCFRGAQPRVGAIAPGYGFVCHPPRCRLFRIFDFNNLANTPAFAHFTVTVKASLGQRLRMGHMLLGLLAVQLHYFLEILPSVLHV